MTHPTSASVPQLTLTLPNGVTQTYALAKGSITIGRQTTCDMVLRHWTVSRRHARIDRIAGGYTITDLGSVNGTRVNGAPITRRPLTLGDVLHVGDCTLRFEAARLEPAPERVTRIDSERDLRDTLIEMPVHVQLEESSVPRAVVHTSEGTWEVPLAGDRLTIGRDPDNDIRLEFPAVSRHHAVIERSGDAYRVRDLRSQNGTWIRRERISSKDIEDGESFYVGPACVLLKRGLSQNDLEAGGEVAKRRPVVIIPGFAGSNLWLGNEQIWPAMRTLGNPSLLAMSHRLDARGVVDDVVVVPNLIKLDQYSLLTGYLREGLGYEPGKDLLEFGYDFRQDNRESARLLAAAIDRWQVSGPITIIAHSMGCLIARYFIERLGGHRKVERAIFIGGPHAGTPYAFASLLRGPNLLPLGMMNLRLREVLATFPSWYQILPTYRCVSSGQSPLDVLMDDTWVADHVRPLLRDAGEFRRELGSQSSVPAVCIFGYGIKTVTEATIERDDQGAVRKADLATSDHGDGMIPERSARLKDSEIHPVRQHHGSLYVDSDVRMRLKLELTRSTNP